MHTPRSPVEGPRARRELRPARAALFTFALLTFTLISSPVLAGCEKDTDCKGDRICEEERCVEPAPSNPSEQPVEAPPSLPAQAEPEPDSAEVARQGRLAAVGDKLVVLGAGSYGYRGKRLDWSGAERLLRTYSRSSETLRKGLGYRRTAIASGVVAGVLAVVGLPMVVAGMAIDTVAVWLPGTILAASGFLVSMTITLPVAVLAKGTRTRAIERYNRAVEDGRAGPGLPH